MRHNIFVLVFVFGFIIIGKAGLFDPYPSLEDFAKLVSSVGN
jgi:hypothetical protein